MQRLTLALAVVGVAANARADELDPVSDAPPPAPAPVVEQAPTAQPAAIVTPAAAQKPLLSAPPDMKDQAIVAGAGIVTGGRTTPGGVRVVGHYLYQLREQDWFEGVAAFTFGSSTAACFRDRDDTFMCDHGFVDGKSVEISANVRRYLAGRRDGYWPFLRAGVGVGIVRFGDDQITGVSVPVHGGGGIRVSISDSLAVIAAAELAVGFAAFGHRLGFEPQLGALITAGAEFGL